MLPEGTDLAQTVKLLKGATPVRHESHYGADDKTRYEEGHYFSAQVREHKPVAFRVELVDDGDVCTRDEWNIRCNVADNKNALPVAA